MSAMKAMKAMQAMKVMKAMKTMKKANHSTGRAGTDRHGSGTRRRASAGAAVTRSVVSSEHTPDPERTRRATVSR